MKSMRKEKLYEFSGQLCPPFHKSYTFSLTVGVHMFENAQVANLTGTGFSFTGRERDRNTKRVLGHVQDLLAIVDHEVVCFEKRV